jgi:hypothetical protein
MMARMGIAAAIHEMKSRDRNAVSRLIRPRLRAAQSRLDELTDQLERLNLQDAPSVPNSLRRSIADAVTEVLVQDPPMTVSPTAAMELVFAAQEEVLRGLAPEFHREQENDDDQTNWIVVLPWHPPPSANQDAT